MLWAALVPGEIPSDESRRIEALEGVATWCLQFTPRVALLEPDFPSPAVVMEVAASARLFGGKRKLVERVRDEAGDLGVIQLSWAPTSLAAVALARAGLSNGFGQPLEQLLDALPLQTLVAVAAHQETLARLGCQTLGQVRALPRGGLSRRFDAQLLSALDQAYGLRPEAHAWHELPDAFKARLELMSRVELAPALLFGARRLMLQMAGWLAARHSGVAAFTLKWCHDVMRSKAAGDGGELTIRTAAPTRDIEHLTRLLAEHLAKVQLLAPVGDLELVAIDVHALEEKSLSLLHTPQQAGESLALVLERIAARLGPDRVLRPVITEDHRLEWMCHWQPAPDYGNLCEFITRLRRKSAKGTYRLSIADVAGSELQHCVVVASPKRMSGPSELEATARWLLKQFVGRCWIGVELLRLLDDEMWLHRLRQMGELAAIPVVACGDVHFHVRSRKPMQDVLTATRLGKPLTECGLDLQPNAERHLRTRLRLAQTYPADLLEETLAVADRCAFSLDELMYQYPDEVVPAGETPASYLRQITYEGAGRRWPAGVPAKVQAQIEHELELIAELRYEHYFLTVADIVAFARSRHILCQGRGSAANSVVCYCSGVTEVDPARMSVLFERFISKERNEPPDIDIDFEHERREEVLQYLYAKYGRERAAITGVVICHRPRSALRDVGKALGFSLETIDALAKGQQWWDGRDIKTERLGEVGLSPDDLQVRQLLGLTSQLMGFPRHLSQHVGGFVLTKGPLSRIVPIENASMKDRTVIQWDKDDLDALGLLKVDCLALGMLTAISKSLAFIGQRRGYLFGLQDIPAEDEATYDMICKADTVGVFQIESRAQMSMLPRLKPRCFYDLVIEVAIVRPGPIVGGMVHPYLNRRMGKEPVTYPSEALREALGRTLGVPVFQEQVMQISMLAAGFTAGEADGLRRAMAAWKRKGGLDRYYDKIVDGMTARGYSKEFAESIFKQIHGFSEYGFPESHAASFALLVYASCWIKHHHPAEFLAAMLNSQPLGFYSPSQLVQDAKRHGVEVRPADVMCSDVDCTLEDLPHAPAVRLGLRMVRGLKTESAQRIVDARRAQVFDSTEDLARRASLEQHEVTQLASADALMSLSGHRRQQVWDASALRSTPLLLREAPVDEDVLELTPALEGEEIMFDYASTGLTLRRHPLALLRPQLRQRRLMSAAEIHDFPNGRLVRYCGLVTLRQQPDTANGVIFVSLEDETGVVQVIVWKSVRDRQRKELLRSRLLAVYGTWQREGELRSLIAGKLFDLTPLLGRLPTVSRDFH